MLGQLKYFWRNSLLTLQYPPELLHIITINKVGQLNNEMFSFMY